MTARPDRASRRRRAARFSTARRSTGRLSSRAGRERPPAARPAEDCSPPSDCRPQDAAPRRRARRWTSWGHLRVLEPIGRGAFGDVYRAWDPRLDREVALKLLPADSAVAGDLGQSPSSKKAGCWRASAIPTSSPSMAPSGSAIASASGWSSSRAARSSSCSSEGRTFTSREVVEIGIELCARCRAVHAAGLLHRDIKAQNVMLADDGRVVLMDFGTGRELDEDVGADSRARRCISRPRCCRASSHVQ